MKLTELDLVLVRQYIYNALHIIFGQSPSESILTALYGKDSLATFEALTNQGDDVYDAAVEAFAATKEHYLESQDKESAFKKLGIEYTRLFVGTGSLPAPPWEMVYKTGRRELFQPGVLEIREIYRSVGCTPAETPHVSDDHLGIELDFMRFVCEKIGVALEQDQQQDAQKLLKVQKSFLEEHLLKWVPKFLADFEAATEEPLYVSSAQLLGAFLAMDEGLIIQALESVSEG